MLSGCALPIIGATPTDPEREHAHRHHGPPPAGPRPLAPPRAAHGGPAAPALPTDPTDCYAALSSAGVPFDALPEGSAPGVRQPVQLRGPLGGVTAGPRGRDPRHGIIDCRLALTLLAWAPTLRHAGVRHLEHYSIYRPGARIARSRKVSAHAHALAIDAARFHLDNGDVVEVLTDWEERDRGGEPCTERPYEAWPSRLMRGVVCDAVSRGLFQVVLTPHHDKAHENHVHLEVRPGVDWTYVR